MELKAYYTKTISRSKCNSVIAEFTFNLIDNEMRKQKRDKHSKMKQGESKDFKTLSSRTSYIEKLDKYYDAFCGYDIGNYDDM